MYDSNPTIYVPVPDTDNGPALRALLASGVRWIQINGEALQIDTTVSLEDDGEPANYVFIQPHPSVPYVVVDASGVGRDPADPTNPSFAAFGYEGFRVPASYLSSIVAAGAKILPVANGALYSVDDWVNVSNASTDPGVTLQPLDGPGAKYRVVAIDGNDLTIDRPAERDHPNNASVSKCKPIFGAIIEGMRFTGDVAVAIHIHDDIGGTYRNNKALDNWSGRVGTLIDNWNIGTLIDDCFTVGTTPGTGLGESTWGVAIEGGSGTRYSACGGSGCGTGLTVNYGYDVRGTGTLAFANNVNLALLTECINCFDVAPRTAGALILDVSESGGNTNSAVIGRRQATAAEQNIEDPTSVDWRSLPLGNSFATNETLLVANASGDLRQIDPFKATLTLNGSACERENILISSQSNLGGNLQLKNTLQHWAVGMLSVANWRDYVLYNSTSGQVDLRVSYDTAQVTTRGDLNIGAGQALKINNVVMLTGRGSSIADASGGGVVDVEARAAVNALLAQLRSGTLPAT